MQLGFDFDTPRLVRVTPARLGVWADCRRRYRLTYLDKPAPPRGGAWAHATLGAVVHLALRALLDLPVAARTPERAAALVDKHWSSEGFRDTAQVAEYRERARGWVAEYAAELPADIEVVAQERWVTVATDRIVAEGRVDRIDRRGDELVIVDYKTGRRSGPEDARDSAALALYAIATERTLRRTCRRVELHHVPDRDGLGLGARSRVARRARRRRRGDRRQPRRRGRRAGRGRRSRAALPAHPRPAVRLLRHAPQLPGGPGRGTGTARVVAARLMRAP